MTKIRLARSTDAAGILAIYAPYIANTSFTFETEIPTESEFANRIASYLASWPWLVCEVDGQVAGYAYASRYRERVAYQWSAECSVYVQDDHHRSGIARALYTALFSILKLQGYRNVYAVINLPNERSVAFHESMGFRWFATYEQVGYKLGQWKNVGWWRLIINEFEQEPAPVISFSLLDQSFVPQLLNDVTGLLNK